MWFACLEWAFACIQLSSPCSSGPQEVRLRLLDIVILELKNCDKLARETHGTSSSCEHYLLYDKLLRSGLSQ